MTDRVLHAYAIAVLCTTIGIFYWKTGHSRKKEHAGLYLMIMGVAIIISVSVIVVSHIAENISFVLSLPVP